MKAVKQLGELPFNVKLVAGRQTVNFEELEALVKDINIEVFRSIDDFEYEMAVSKYAIGASGISNWERFCLHLPTSIVSVADNQVELSEYLASLNAVNYLGDARFVNEETYIKELERLVKIWPFIHYQTVIDVDGLGAMRLVEYIQREIG